MGNIRLKGSNNIRDLGGIKVKEGIIKNNKLIRGNLLNNLTKEDIEILIREHKLSTILDLRTSGEIQKQKDISIPKVKYINIPIFEDDIIGVTHKQKNIKNVDKMEIDMKKIYEKMLSTYYLDNISKIIKFIMKLRDNQYSVLFHCTQGKDRTGVIAAILLMILGGSKEIIIEDYLYTNKANRTNVESYKPKLLDDKFNLNKTETSFLAKKEYIEVIFHIVESEWNGIDNFIENGLKIEKEDIIRFKEKVIEFC